jgi:hypothetical protein
VRRVRRNRARKQVGSKRGAPAAVGGQHAGSSLFVSCLPPTDRAPSSSNSRDPLGAAPAHHTRPQLALETGGGPRLGGARRVAAAAGRQLSAFVTTDCKWHSQSGCRA